MTSRTEPQYALTFVAPSQPDTDFEHDTTLLLVRRPVKHQPPRWNPPLPLTNYARLFK